MGISLEQYRCRIGLCSQSQGAVSSSSNSSQSHGFLLSWTRKLLPFASLLLLLVIAGVEVNPGPTLPCKFCNQTFASTSSYFQHMKIHQTVWKFTIPFCFCSRTVKLGSFESHISRFHQSVRFRPQVQQIKSVYCSVCKIELNTKKGYMDHMQGHLKNGTEIQCVLSNCNLKFCGVRKFQKQCIAVPFNTRK